MNQKAITVFIVFPSFISVSQTRYVDKVFECISVRTLNYSIRDKDTLKSIVYQPVNDSIPLYQWLTQQTKNGKTDSSVKWNFQKYLVNPKGHLVDYYLSATNPLSDKITKHLQ